MLKNIISFSALMITGILFGGQGPTEFQGYEKLPKDMQGEVLKHMNPFCLAKVSLTSKKQRSLIQEIWGSLQIFNGTPLFLPRVFKKAKVGEMPQVKLIPRRLTFDTEND